MASAGEEDINQTTKEYEFCGVLMGICRANLHFLKEDFDWCHENMTRVKTKYFSNNELSQEADLCLKLSEENLKNAIQNLSHWQKRLKELLKISSPETDAQNTKQDWKF